MLCCHIFIFRHPRVWLSGIQLYRQDLPEKTTIHNKHTSAA